jgi:hypothetical protein
MKRAILLALPLVLVMLVASAVRAEEKKASEWKVSVGCAHCNYSKETGASSCGASAKLADGKVVALKGKAMKDVKFKQGGEYVVTGTLAEDGKSIEVDSIKKQETKKDA